MRKDLIFALKLTFMILFFMAFFIWGCMICGSVFFLGGKEHDKVIWFVYSTPLYIFLSVFIIKRFKIA